MSNWFFSPKTDREFSNELETETVPELNCILKQRAILFTRSLQRFRNPQSLLYSFSQEVYIYPSVLKECFKDAKLNVLEFTNYLSHT